MDGLVGGEVQVSSPGTRLEILRRAVKRGVLAAARQARRTKLLGFIKRTVPQVPLTR